MKRIPKAIIAFLSGMLTALPIVFPKLFIIGILSFCIPAYIEYSSEGKSACEGWAYLRGLSFFMGFGVMIFSWFNAMYPLEFTGLGKGAAVAVVCAGWFGLSLLQALFWALLFWAMSMISKRCTVKQHPLMYSFLFTCLYVVFEWLSTKTWTAVPWGRLAVGQTEFLPMIQVSSLFGEYAVSFILVFFGCTLGVSYAEYRKNSSRRAFRPLVIAAVILTLNITFGTVRVLMYEVPEGSRQITVAAVQGNISSHEKWTEESLQTTKREYMALTTAASEEGADIAVFPETPITYNIDGSNGYSVQSYYESVAGNTGCTVITGAFTKNGDDKSENSVIAISPTDGLSDEKYVKRHLVPFGEYVPMRKIISVIFPPLSDISMLSSDLVPGKEPTVLNTEYGKVAPLICFDSIYETLAIDSIRAGGELITLSTNDSWFLDSPAVWEHNRHAVLRGVECGRYVVRSANTGVSSVISPIGEILESLPPLENGYITADVYMINEKTPYTVIGNVFVPICAIGAVMSVLYCFLKHKKEEYV